MPNFVSPGVYVIENDLSDYPAQINSSVVGIVGFADRGPIAGLNNQKATLVTSQSGLIDTFGEPAEHIKGQALEGALEILEATTSMRFIRCVGDGATNASAVAQLGGCPAVILDVTPCAMPAIGTADLTTSDVKFVITAYDQDRAKIIDNKTYLVPKNTLSLSSTNGGTSIAALKKVVGGALDADRVGAFALDNTLTAEPYIVGLAAGDTATLEIASYAYYDNGAGAGLQYNGINMLSALDYDGVGGAAASSVTASGVSIATNGASYLVESLWQGAGYNAGTKTDGTTSGVSFEVGVNGGANTTEQVNNLGIGVESFIAGMTSSAFIEDQIGTSYDDRTSAYLTGQIATGVYDNTVVPTPLSSFVKPLESLLPAGTYPGSQGAGTSHADVNPRFIKLVQGTYNLANGNSGIPTDEDDVKTAIIGAVRSDGGKTGMEALDDPVLNVSIALAPGTGVGDVAAIQNGLITVAERTTDFLAAISPPYAVGKPGDAIDWSNGFAGTRSVAVNSSYAALYWPWVKVFQPFDGKDRWLAPEIYGVRQMCVTDAVADPWFAPAGFVRGRLTKPTDIEVILNQGDRDSMYSGGNCINPIVNFPQNGIAIFGQRTTQRQPTALDRINVRRMMIYIKKVILASTQRLVFEPNDKFTWARVEQLINPLLDDINRRRGITAFKVICDESTNTPIRVDRNEMWTKVLIKPTKSAEMVIFELNLTSQSATIG